MTARLQLVAIAVCACMAGCGTPGAPQPPSLQLARPVSDLAATRVGDTVTLTWTAPRETTDGVAIRHPGVTEICRQSNVILMVTCSPIAHLPAAAGPSQTYQDVLPPQLQAHDPSGFVTYAVETENDRGRSAGLSNQIRVPLAPTIAAPNAPSARIAADAIEVSVSGARYALPAGIEAQLHLYRHGPTGAEADLGAARVSLEAAGGYVGTFSDHAFAWEQTYFYRAAWITIVPGNPAVQVMGASSPETSVTAHDVFPPARPNGLEAVASGVGQPPFIDLTWAPNTESDLAGYNVYRHEEGQEAVKINDKLIAAPAFRDAQVQRGHKYFYSVSAVDLRGNESPQSAEASEIVP